MGKWATLTVLSVVSGCGSDERRSSPLEPGPLPEDSFSLVVSVGEGVVGTPREGTYTYPAGTNISYSYTAIDGYEETLVVLDNTVSLASAGQITVSAPRVLGVLARKIPQIDPEDAAVVQAAGELLSSANTRGAYEAYVREVRRMYEEYGADEGRARALAVSQSVFGVADFAQVQALQAALAGEVFSFADTEGVSQQLTRGADVPVEMIYVNGMFTPEEEGHVAAVELIFLMREMSLPFSMPVKLFYNGSAFRRVREGVLSHYFRLTLHCRGSNRLWRIYPSISIRSFSPGYQRRRRGTRACRACPPRSERG